MTLDMDVREVSAPVLVLDCGVDSAALLLALPGREAGDWPCREVPAATDSEAVDAARALLAENGLERPSLTLICGMGRHSEEERSAEGRAARIARWREELRASEGSPEACMHGTMPGWEVSPLLEAVKSAFGPALAADSGTASVLSALAMESLRDRCWNEGVTVVFADETHTQAFVLFREKVLGLYENHAGLSRDALLADLKELRLNWLPDEQVRAAGGHGCICGDFPAEAEGFRPTWILGPRREELKGAGRMASPCGDARFERCFGMLYGLSRRMEAGE
jgi:uncharacterized protein (DUF1786 family)